MTEIDTEESVVEAEPNETYQAFLTFAKANGIDDMEQAFAAFVGRTIQTLQNAKRSRS